MQDWLNRVSKSWDAAKAELDTKLEMVKEHIGALPVIVSLERSEAKDVQYDEKHYFVIPNHTCDIGFSLHTMRSLPSGSPEINDLPKRRVFHFPNEHYEGALRLHMVETARSMAIDTNSNTQSTLEKLADDIDAMDSKLTYGMLAVGALAAIFNPLIGAGIALKAVLPSISGMLSRHGLKPLGEKATRAQIEQKAKQAEEHVLAQFAAATTLKVTNPILNELEFALRTNEQEHDPLHDPNLANASLPALEHCDWRHLTEVAISHVYKEILADPEKHAKAKLGPEDIRWLQVLLAGK